jgi:hypothetical protein
MNALSMTERNKIIGLLSMGWTQRQIVVTAPSF